jgi:hypothetical protein
MQLRATVDVSEAVAGLDDLQKSQIPFALAKTLTGCAKAAQAKVQENLGGKFTLRNDFTLRGIRIKPAEKRASVIEADVHTDTANRATGAPDYLLPQEEGGEKVPHNGRAHLAVPTRYLRQLAPGIIPAELRPRNLMALSDNAGKYPAMKRGSRERIMRNPRLVRGFYFFIEPLKDGIDAILGRYTTDRDAYPFYLLIPEASIKPRLQMQQDVEAAVQSAFPGLWADTWKTIMARGLRF